MVESSSKTKPNGKPNRNGAMATHLHLAGRCRTPFQAESQTEWLRNSDFGNT